MILPSWAWEMASIRIQMFSNLPCLCTLHTLWHTECITRGYIWLCWEHCSCQRLSGCTIIWGEQSWWAVFSVNIEDCLVILSCLAVLSIICKTRKMCAAASTEHCLAVPSLSEESLNLKCLAVEVWLVVLSCRVGWALRLKIVWLCSQVWLYHQSSWCYPRQSS